MLRRARLAALMLLLPISVGCLRYTPSRSELRNQKQAKSSGPAQQQQQFAGPELFQSFEQKLVGRRTHLMRERERLAGAAMQATYRVGRGDQIEVQVFGLSELTSVSDVSPDGVLQLPLLGAVQAGGKTLSEIRADLTVQYAKYVRSPRIQVAIKEYHAHPVSVIGAVAKPGPYALTREGQTLSELIALAGGRTDKAGSRVILIPASPAGPGAAAQSAHGVEFDFDDLMGTVDTRPAIVPLVGGDMIVVPEMGSFKVDGEVIKAGSFPLTPRTSALGAVAAAGGLTYSANVNEVEVIRDFGDGKKASLTVDLEQVALNGAADIPLRDGDVIRVPSEPGRFRTRQLVEAINGFFRGGVSGSVRYQ